MSRYSDLKDEDQRAGRGRPGKRRSLLGQLTHAAAQLGPGIAHLGGSAWRTATAMQRFQQGQPSRGQTRPYSLRDIGDVATYGALSRGPGAFEQATGGPTGLLPELLTSFHTTGQNVRHPTRYVRAARNQEGYGEIVPMLLQDIGNAALVAAPTSLALRGATRAATTAGRTTAAARLGTATNIAQRVAAVGGEVADLGLPRLAGAGTRSLLPPSAAAVAEAASRGRRPSVFVGPAEAAGRAIRYPFRPGTTTPDTWRYNMAKRYPTILTDTGRAATRGYVNPGRQAGEMAYAGTFNPVQRAAMTPTLEDVAMPPPTGMEMPPPGAAGMPPPILPPPQTPPPGSWPPEPRTPRRPPRQTQVSRLQPYTPEDLLGRGLRDAPGDIWELGPDGTLHLKPQYQEQYAPTGRGAVSMGETMDKILPYAFETELGANDWKNLEQGVLTQIDANRLGVPYNKAETQTWIVRNDPSLAPDQPALVRPLPQETTYLTPEGQVPTVKADMDDSGAQQRTIELRNAITDFGHDHPDWQQMDDNQLFHALNNDPAMLAGNGRAQVIRQVTGGMSGPTPLAEVLRGVMTGEKVYARHKNGLLGIYDVADLTRKAPPLVVPKGAWRSLPNEETASIIAPKIQDLARLDLDDIERFDAATVDDIGNVARSTLDSLNRGTPNDQLRDAAQQNLDGLNIPNRAADVSQSWQIYGNRARAEGVLDMYFRLNDVAKGIGSDTPDYIRGQLEGIVAGTEQLLATPATPDIEGLLGDNASRGLGGFERIRPRPEPGTVRAPEGGYLAPPGQRRRQRTAVARGAGTPPPPPPLLPPVTPAGLPPPEGNPLYVNAEGPPTETLGGGAIPDEPLTVDEQNAALAINSGMGKGIQIAARESGMLGPAEVAGAVVPTRQRQYTKTLTGEEHPEFVTPEAAAMADAYLQGTLPPEQMARIGRALAAPAWALHGRTQMHQAGIGQDVLDPSQVEVRPSPMPVDAVVKYLADAEFITPEEAHHLRGEQFDPDAGDAGEWVSEGLDPDEIRQRRTQFYESDPRFQADDPVLREPLIYAQAWRNPMAVQRRTQAHLEDYAKMMEESGLGGMDVPQLSQTPAQLGRLGLAPRYMPAGTTAAETVALNRQLETIGTTPGRLPTRSEYVHSAEVPTGPGTFELLGERLGTEARRSVLSDTFTRMLDDLGGRLGDVYGWHGDGPAPDNPWFTAGELHEMHNNATAQAARSETYDAHYNRELVARMKAKGNEPWPKEGALGQELTLQERARFTGRQELNAAVQERAFAREPSDIDADTPWLPLGLRDRLAPHITDRVPGAVVAGLNKFNRVFKGVTLAPNIRWQIGDAVTHYLLGAMEGVSPAEMRTNVNRARAMGGQIGARPRERVRGRLAPESVRYGGSSEAYKRLLDHQRQMNTRIDVPNRQQPVRGGRAQPGRAPTPEQRGVSKFQKVWDPTVGRFVDASYRFNQTGNNLRREAMFLAQLDRRLQRAGLSLDDPATLERVSRSSQAVDPELHADIVAAVERTNKILGDTEALAPFERDYLTSIFPFWTWTSTVARLTSHLAINHPARLLFTMYLGTMAANGQSPDLPGYQGTVEGPGGWWPTAFANPFADIGGLPGLEEGGDIGAGSILRSASPAIKLPAAFAGYDLGQGQDLSRPQGTGRRDPYGREGLTPILGDLGAMAYQTLSQVPMGRRALNLLPRATIPLPGTDITTGNVVRYDTGESMGFGAGTPLPTRLGGLAGLPLPFSQSRTAETQRLIAEREATHRKGARSRAKSKRRRRAATARLPRFP